MPLRCARPNGIIQLVRVWPPSVKPHLNHDWLKKKREREGELKGGGGGGGDGMVGEGKGGKKKREKVSGAHLR